MNSLEMVEENCRIASDHRVGSFAENDHKLVDEIKKIIKEKEKVPCTACRYCQPCPKGVDIPGIFNYYNMMYIDNKFSARFEFAQVMGMRKEPGFADQCIECGLCEKHCPQHLSIRAYLKEADKALRPWPYKIGIDIARKILIKS